jgi:hypothetical protein
LALTLAHQHVGQLTPELRSAIFGNVASWVLFRLGMPDATAVAEELTEYSARDLARLANYRCVVHTSVNGRVLQPFDVQTMPPPDQMSSAETREAIKTLSALTYGRAIDLVEGEYLESWGRVAEQPAPMEEAAETPTVEPATEPEDAPVLFDVPVFGESEELSAGRGLIARLLGQGDLEGALEAIKQVFIRTDYSPDCWDVFEGMKAHFAGDGTRDAYEAMRLELQALAAGPLQQ